MKPNNETYLEFKESVIKNIAFKYDVTVKEITEDIDIDGDVVAINVLALKNVPVEKINVNIKLIK